MSPARGGHASGAWLDIDWAAVVARKRKRVPQDPRVRFTRWHCVVESGCWEWQGCTKRGYGLFFIDGRSQFAHRVSWTFANGLADRYGVTRVTITRVRSGQTWRLYRSLVAR